MKLKHVLTEGPISYRGAGGERYAAWEEPNDEGPEHEPQSKSGETVMPYCTADGTDIKVRVEYEVSFDHQANQGEIQSVKLLSVVLPSGKEVDAATASNILGADQFGEEGEDTLAEWLCDHLKDEEGETYQLSDSLRGRKQPVARPQASAQAQTSAPAPAAAPAATPTAA